MFILGCTRSSLLCGLSLVAARKGCSLIAVRRLLAKMVSSGSRAQAQERNLCSLYWHADSNHRTTWEAHRLVFSLQAFCSLSRYWQDLNTVTRFDLAGMSSIPMWDVISSHRIHRCSEQKGTGNIKPSKTFEEDSKLYRSVISEFKKISYY